MDLLHVYSKQSSGTPPVQSLVDKARESKRRAGRTAGMKRARQLRPEEIEALITHYRENGSVVAAAKAFGVTRQTAGKYLADAGINTTRRMSESEILAARAARSEGQSATAIARLLGYSPNTILAALSG